MPRRAASGIRTSGTVPEDVLSWANRKLELATVPCLDPDAAAAANAAALEDLVTKKWPAEVRFPHVFVGSTLHRDSWIHRTDTFSLLIHDEGGLDLAVAAAGLVGHHTRQSASYVTYLFIFEQFVANGRPDLALLLAQHLFLRDGGRHEAVTGSDCHEFREFIWKEAQFDVRPPSRGFKLVGGGHGAQEFQSVGQLVFLCHELGHLIAGEGGAQTITASLGMSDVDEEVAADVVGLALTASALTRSWGFNDVGAMTSIFSKALVLLRIHHAFTAIRRQVRALFGATTDSGGDRPESGSATRPDIVRELLSDPKRIGRIFKWAGSRAGVVAATLAHHNEYADIVVSSMERSARAFLFLVRQKLELVMRDRPNEWLEQRRELATLTSHQLIVAGREPLGNDIFRVLGAYSNQAPKMLPPRWRVGWERPQKITWHQPLPLFQSHGILFRQFPSGVLMDVSQWKIEPLSGRELRFSRPVPT
jgi:hypothetical protein